MDVFFDWRWWLIRKILCYTILDKVSADTIKNWQRTCLQNNFLKIKIKFHCDEVTDFYKST